MAILDLSVIENIRASGGTFASVSAYVDSVCCDVRRERGEVVVYTTASREEVARGVAVPAELVAALEKGEKESREFVNGALEGSSPRSTITVVHPDLLADDKG